MVPQRGKLLLLKQTSPQCYQMPTFAQWQSYAFVSLKHEMLWIALCNQPWGLGNHGFRQWGSSPADHCKFLKIIMWAKVASGAPLGALKHTFHSFHSGSTPDLAAVCLHSQWGLRCSTCCWIPSSAIILLWPCRWGPLKHRPSQSTMNPDIGKPGKQKMLPRPPLEATARKFETNEWKFHKVCNEQSCLTNSFSIHNNKWCEYLF